METRFKFLIPGPKLLDYTPTVIQHRDVPHKVDCKISIITLNRQGGYVHQTLASMFASGYQGEVSLLVGTPDDSFLSHYRHHRQVKINTISLREWEEIRSWAYAGRICYNWARCGDEGNHLILEDDVVFVDGWFEQMQKVLCEIESLGYQDYVLSLWNDTYLPTRRIFAWWPAMAFYGGQGLFIPQTVLGRVLAGVRKGACADGGFPPDICVKECCVFEDIRIFVSKHSLLRHVGVMSSTQEQYA